MFGIFASALSDPNFWSTLFVQVGYVITGPEASVHVARMAGVAVSGVTLCGLGTTGMLIGRAVLFVGHTNCEDCRRKYSDAHPTVDEMDFDEDAEPTEIIYTYREE